MTEQPIWSMEQLVLLLSDIATQGWAISTAMYGTHSGDFREEPWRGPLACEIAVTGWRKPNPVTLDHLNALAALVERHGARIGFSVFGGDENRGIARIGTGDEYAERILIANYISQEKTS